MDKDYKIFKIPGDKGNGCSKESQDTVETWHEKIS